MKTLILIGRSGCGKSALTARLTGTKYAGGSTQSAKRTKWVIDTPGSFAENRTMAGALSLYAYEADIVGLVISAQEPYSIYNPNIAGMVNREVVGIVTKTDIKTGNAERAERWLRLAGCKKVFRVSLISGEGIDRLLNDLSD
ncbi:MAG TPA: ethanolamine utilization protein EutP [Ruminococcaceae bacterium]|nr:ethanolamine utilization protein EutP [Oscillospiraceae bacterium]